MGMKKRITDKKTVIARCDRSLTLVPQETLKKYFETLDIDVLGPLPSLIEPPTLFAIMPLKARWAHLDRGTDNTAADYWQIFALHVERIDGAEIALEFDGQGDFKALTESVREQIPEDYIRDIAQMIIQLANGEGNHVPFDVLVGLSGTISARRANARPSRHRVTVTDSAPSGSEDVKPKSSATPKTRQKKKASPNNS